MQWRISEPAELLRAVRLALLEGGRFLLSRIAPNGPILRERNLSYVHKASWGMYAAGVDHQTIGRLLDWAQREALRPNGDFFFPEEGPEYKDMQRVYRPLTFGKVAAWIGHPVIRLPQVLERILQYQDSSGGVFHWIGDDPKRPERPATLGSLNTTFFGHLMIALDMPEQAIAAGRWVRQWVQANREAMAQGRLFTLMTPEGRLVTQVEPGQRLSRLVDRQSPKQEFWQVGTAMAYLAVLYETMRTRWGASAAQAQPYLDAALALLDFEAAMPLDSYLWPSKCKVGWGAGELLRVLAAHRLAGPETLETAYRVAERVTLFTFMDNQLPGGGWPPMHYPLSELAPEIAFSYKPLKGLVGAPAEPIPGSATIFLPAEEITGEFLGEIKSIEQGLAAYLG
ncbi:MAG: hypothetical protein ACUVUC_15290 [Thermoguttaceae bacterium]